MKNQGSPEQMQQLEELNDQLVASLDAVDVNNPLQIEQEGVGKLLTKKRGGAFCSGKSYISSGFLN